MKIKHIIESIEKNKKRDLSEAISDIVYHYANLKIAAKILKSGEFRLALASVDPIEKRFQPKSDDYFMSVTRTKLGSFHANGTRTTGVLFVLDGRWFNQRYKGAPVEYFSGGRSSGRSEAEDRIFSKEPTIPIKPVVEMHILLNSQGDSYMQPPEAVRTILIEAKRRGIPYYVYFNHDDWIAQNKRKALDSKEYLRFASGNSNTNGDRGYNRLKIRINQLLKIYQQLIRLNDYDKLDKNSQQYASEISRGEYYYKFLLDEFADAMNQERKPNDEGYELATKFTSVIRRNFGSPEQMFAQLSKKWKKIIDERNERERWGIW